MIYEKAKQVQDEVGHIDILINNAGIVQGKFFIDYSDQEIQKTIEINTIAHFWLLKAFLPSMIQHNKGTYRNSIIRCRHRRCIKIIPILCQQICCFWI